MTDRAPAPELSSDEALALLRIELAKPAPESFDPIATLRRVEALADKWEADAKRADDAEPVTSDDLTRMILGARYLRMNAADLRAALAGTG